MVMSDPVGGGGGRVVMSDPPPYFFKLSIIIYFAFVCRKCILGKMRLIFLEKGTMSIDYKSCCAYSPRVSSAKRSRGPSFCLLECCVHKCM